MQIHDQPEDEWRQYLSLVDNDMEVLAYCQELDPVATMLRDSLSQYMQFLRVPSRAPKRKTPTATSTWARAALDLPAETQQEQQQQAAPRTLDLVDLLLSAPTGRAGPIQTSTDLLRLACQPFNDADDSRGDHLTPATPGNSSNTGGYSIPRVLGKIRLDSPRDKWSRQANKAWMPFGWQQCQSSTAFTGKSTNLALTMAQQEMLRAGV